MSGMPRIWWSDEWQAFVTADNGPGTPIPKTHNLVSSECLPEDAAELLTGKPEWRILADNQHGHQVVWYYAASEEKAREVMAESTGGIAPYSNLVLTRRLTAETDWEVVS